MVHALEESWRVLDTDGVLIDIRPHMGNMRLEVLSDADHQLAGLVDDSVLIPDQQAANSALKHGLNSGLFIKEEERFFDYVYIWDTPEDLKAYVDENWVNRNLQNSLYRKVRRMAAKVTGSSRIRIRDVRIIARYRKINN